MKTIEKTIDQIEINKNKSRDLRRNLELIEEELK